MEILAAAWCTRTCCARVVLIRRVPGFLPGDAASTVAMLKYGMPDLRDLQRRRPLMMFTCGFRPL